MKTDTYAVVVNDDPTQLNVLSGLVRKSGLEPRAFRGAEAALADMSLSAGRLNENAGNLPVLIVTDLYMPGIDGWRFCRLLRSPEYAVFNHIPILVVSATFTGDEPDRIAADLGAQAFLPSPVDGRQFVAQVQAILNGQKLYKPSSALIVEDSRTLARILQKSFSANGYHADMVSTAAEATAAFARASYDIAVLDHHLPDGFGLDLIDSFRVLRPDCVCILMTTDPGPNLALDGMKRGAAAFLRKPFDPEYLIEICAHARRERSLLRVQDFLEIRTRELRESEERFRRLSENTPGYICTFLPDSTMTYVNPALAEFTGIPPDTLVGRRFLELLDPLEREYVRERLASLTPDTHTESHEQSITAVDGSIRYQEWRNRAFFDENGQVSGYMAVGIDITVRKQAEKLLKQKSIEKRLLLDTIPTQIWYMIDIETYGAVNQAHADFLGLPIQAIAHKKQEEFLAADVAAINRESNIRVFNTGLPVVTEAWITNPFGERRLIHITKTPKLDEQGRVEFVVCAGNDITELRSLERRFRGIFEKAPLGIEIYDTEGKLVAANPACIDIFGIADENEIMGFNLFDDPNLTEDIKSKLRRGEIVHYESPFDFEKVRSADIYRTTRSGIIHLSVLITLLESNDRLDLSGYLVIIQDITRQKQYETECLEFERSLLKLQKAESLARMAGAIAHTFNNKLHAVMGNLEMALNDLPTGTGIWKHLTEAQKAAGSASEISGSMLTYLGQTVGGHESMDLSEICRNSLPLLQIAAPKGVRIHADFPDFGPVIQGNAGLIQQALTHLVTNAWEAVGRNPGDVCVSVYTVSQAEILAQKRFPIDWHPREIVYACLEIKDTGCGFAPSDVENIFDPFFSTKFTGRGLGLPIVIGIAGVHQGGITVENGAEGGSIFRLLLPVYCERV